MQKDDLWVPQRIAKSLEDNKLGNKEECLVRKKPLPRSSKVSASDRPKAIDHYDSMEIKELLFEPTKIVLVDDVITRGATALGAVNKITEMFPNAEISMFAVMRTISNPNEFVDVVDPCIGETSLVLEDTYRSP